MPPDEGDVVTDGRYATDDLTGRVSDAQGYDTGAFQAASTGEFPVDHSGAYAVGHSGGYPVHPGGDDYGGYGSSYGSYGYIDPGYGASGEWAVPAQHDSGAYHAVGDASGMWDTTGTGAHAAYGYGEQVTGQWAGTGYATAVADPWAAEVSGTGWSAVPAAPAYDDPQRNDASWSGTAMWPVATAAWAETADAWAPDARADAWGDRDEWAGDNRADDLFGPLPSQHRAERAPADSPHAPAGVPDTAAGDDATGETGPGAAATGEPTGEPGSGSREAGTAAGVPARPKARRRAAAADDGEDTPSGTETAKARRRVSGAPIALMGVAVMAVAAVGGIQAADTQTDADVETVAGDVGVSPLDQKLLDVRAGAVDFAERASRTQTRIALEERQQEVARQAEEERVRREALRPKFALPVTQHGLSAYYGSSGSRWASTHTGIDFPVAYGTPVRAVTDGVVRTEWNNAYGNMVIIRAKDGTETWYCHLSRAKVRSGPVKAGDVVAYSGNSGNSTGPHLHFEVRPDGGDPINPLTWLRARGLDPA